MTGETPRGTRHMFADIDVSKPNIARVYDALLGGKDNFAADREFVAKILQQAPRAPLWAKGNRAFLRRVVRHLVGDVGISQFLDIGSGLPTQGNVSEVAHDLDPTVHVVHVDNDPVVFTHSKALLADARTTEIVLADVRDPAGILADPGVRALIDFDRPVGLLLFAILHHIEDHENPGWIATQLRDAMPPGSYLAISSFRMPGPEAAELRAATIEGERLLAGHLGSGRWREDEEILAWFGDWELLEPGLVSMPDWRPPIRGRVRHDEVYHSSLCGLARKKALLPELVRQV
ncbi:MAG: SAM-dependent methyltransferase [Streptosporangiaceae bacterium]|nr:SAM-dependent methyltransferase [Streptosporangiaceae bacterium]